MEFEHVSSINDYIWQMRQNSISPNVNYTSRVLFRLSYVFMVMPFVPWKLFSDEWMKPTRVIRNLICSLEGTRVFFFFFLKRFPLNIHNLIRRRHHKSYSHSQHKCKSSILLASHVVNATFRLNVSLTDFYGIIDVLLSYLHKSILALIWDEGIF